MRLSTNQWNCQRSLFESAKLYFPDRPANSVAWVLFTITIAIMWWQVLGLMSCVTRWDAVHVMRCSHDCKVMGVWAFSPFVNASYTPPSDDRMRSARYIICHNSYWNCLTTQSDVFQQMFLLRIMILAEHSEPPKISTCDRATVPRIAGSFNLKSLWFGALVDYFIDVHRRQLLYLYFTNTREQNSSEDVILIILLRV